MTNTWHEQAACTPDGTEDGTQWCTCGLHVARTHWSTKCPSCDPEAYRRITTALTAHELADARSRPAQVSYRLASVIHTEGAPA